jgi:Fanconi-associated nuclease 1
LEALLAQKRWRRGRRGRWYDRRALILTTHFPKDDLDIAKRAMQGVVEALLDNDTHISRCLTNVPKPGAHFYEHFSVHRPMLQRRLARLEKKLNVPPEERHTNAGQLQKAEETTVEGIRIYKRASSLYLDNTRAVNKTPLQSAGESSLRWTPKSLRPTKISTVALKSEDEVRLQISS